MVLANSRSLFLVKKRCIIEYHQRRNQIASYDDAERQPVALYKVGIVWVQGQGLEARHSCVREVAFFPSIKANCVRFVRYDQNQSNSI